MVIAMTMLAAAAWSTSPSLRQRVTNFFEELHKYEQGDISTSAGYRLEFWRESVGFIADSPG